MRYAVLAVILAPVLASAVPPRDAEAALADLVAQFKDLDADKNGVLTHADAAAPKGRPSRGRLPHDRDGDGRVTLLEFVHDRLEHLHAARPAVDAGRLGFHRADADGNGVLTEPEFDLVLRRRFVSMDRDGDARLTLADLYHEAPGGAKAARGRKLHELMAHDADKDGAITYEEYRRFELPLLLTADADRDGRLTAEEAGHPAHHAPEAK